MTGPTVTGLLSVQLTPTRWAVLVDTGGAEPTRLGPYDDTREALRVAMEENRRHRPPGVVRAQLTLWEE